LKLLNEILIIPAVRLYDVSEFKTFQYELGYLTYL